MLSSYGDSQYLQEIRGMLISLGKQTQREYSNGIVTPGFVYRDE
jgi:hypothetical protein